MSMGKMQVKVHWLFRISDLANLRPVCVSFLRPCLVFFPLTTWIIKSAVSLNITYISHIDLYIKLRRLVLQCCRSISSPHFSRHLMAQPTRPLFAFHCQEKLASHSLHRFLSISGPHLESQHSLKPQHPDMRSVSRLLLPFIFKIQKDRHTIGYRNTSVYFTNALRNVRSLDTESVKQISHSHGRWCVFQFSKDGGWDKTARLQRMGPANEDTRPWNLWGRALEWCACWNKAFSVLKALAFMNNINS